MYPRAEIEDNITVLKYEVDMLRFCLERVRTSPTAWTDHDRNLHIEGFLLHYRNLIGSFSGRDPHASLRMSKPEVFGLTAQHASRYMTVAGPLFDKYKGKISQYLSHCAKRPKDTEWPISQMYNELEPAIQHFDRDCLERNSPAMPVGNVSGSTVTATAMRTMPEFEVQGSAPKRTMRRPF